MSSRKKLTKNPSKQISSYLITAGLILLAASLLLFSAIFQPVILAELSYIFNRPDPRAKVALKKLDTKTIVPVDKQFGIVIPRIRANARIVANVNPFDEHAYQIALTKGVAHARGTVYPGHIGNIFLFSHSSVNFYEANRYNSVFYLLNKLQKNDPVYLFYQGAEFKYKVVETKIVEANQVQYLSSISNDKTLTLMTCWPPSTTLKRLVVIAKIASLDKK